jgi:NCS2 family nucleobase:cation symporter-2
MYAGAIAVPLIVGAAFALPKAQLANLVDADLFACGLATLVQTIGFRAVGLRLPVMMGASFVCVAPILAVAHQPGGDLGMVFGGVMIAGLFGLAIAPFGGTLVRLFPPIVTGSVILVIGLSLMTVAAAWTGGGFGARDFGAPKYLLVAGLVLAIILVLLGIGRGFVRNVAVLIGIAAGCVVTALLGWISLAGIGSEPYVAFVHPFQIAVPRFNFSVTLAMCLVMIVTMIESTGMFLALGEITQRPVSNARLRRGLRADAVGTLLGGLFNAFPYTSYSQNVGLVAITGVRSRWVCAAAGALLLLLGVLPRLGFLVASIPQPVLGGAGFVMFGMVAATGIRILGGVDYTDQRNLIVVALAVGVGMIPTIMPTLFAALPAAFSTIFGSGIVLCAITGVVLRAVFARTPAL